MASTRIMQNEFPVASPRAGHLQASLTLAFEQLGGRTVLTASKQEPPLRVVRAFPTADGAALVHLHNLSGGLLGGDCIELDMRIEAGASAQVTTTGATRLYRPRAEARARMRFFQSVKLKFPELFPKPVIKESVMEDTRDEIA